ncbi:DUF6387 family protein [Methylobacter luteus]|uniref:DUF6387 family protein n=1 Tax=Methylobacter luteus TaxID=415 RepID=UPI000422AFA7|nr:DUF6387 family protein [Methylobacter luteus]
MAEELDTSWFDIKNYEVLKTLSIDGWANVLGARYANHYGMTERDCPWWMDTRIPYPFLLPRAAKLRKGIVYNGTNNIGLDYKVNSILKGDPFSTTSVNSLSSYELALLVDDDLPQVWEACRHVAEYDARCFDSDSDLIPDKNLTKIASTSHDINVRQGWNTSHHLAYVAIDLYATDEQIKEDFNHWLTNYRKEVKHQSPEKLFKQADFDYWIKFSIIPYLDLMFISRLEGKKITQNKMAGLIFPEEYNVDRVERLRKVTKPEADHLIKNKIYEALSAQSLFEKTTGMKKA